VVETSILIHTGRHELARLAPTQVHTHTRVEDEGEDVAAPQPGLLHPALDGRVVGVGEREQAVELVLRHPTRPPPPTLLLPFLPSPGPL